MGRDHHVALLEQEVVGVRGVVPIVREIPRHHVQQLVRLQVGQVAAVLFRGGVAALFEEAAVVLVFVLPVGATHAGSTHAVDALGGTVREIDVVEAAVLPADLREQLVQDARQQGLHTGEIRIRIEGVQAHADGRDAVHGAFHRGAPSDADLKTTLGQHRPGGQGCLLKCMKEHPAERSLVILPVEADIGFSRSSDLSRESVVFPGSTFLRKVTFC